MAATSNEKRGKLHLDNKLARVSVLSLSLSLPSPYLYPYLRESKFTALYAFRRFPTKCSEKRRGRQPRALHPRTRNVFQLLRSFKPAWEREREREPRATRTRAATHIFSASRHRAGRKRFSRASRASRVSARRSRLPDDKSSSTESRARFRAADSILEMTDGADRHRVAVFAR